MLLKVNAKTEQEAIQADVIDKIAVVKFYFEIAIAKFHRKSIACLVTDHSFSIYCYIAFRAAQVATKSCLEVTF